MALRQGARSPKWTNPFPITKLLTALFARFCSYAQSMSSPVILSEPAANTFVERGIFTGRRSEEAPRLR
jgi:hypothetical protein